MSSMPIISYSVVSTYHKDPWTDAGSHARNNVSVFEPEIPAGSHILGMYAQGNYERPKGSSVIITGVVDDDPNNPALKPPKTFEPIWWGLQMHFPVLKYNVLWAVIPPPNYFACGSVVSLVDTTTPGFPRPKDIPVVCVRYDLCRQLDKPPVWVWNDANSGNPRNASIWKIPGLNTMIANDVQDSPPNPIWVPSNLPSQLLAKD